MSLILTIPVILNFVLAEKYSDVISRYLKKVICTCVGIILISGFVAVDMMSESLVMSSFMMFFSLLDSSSKKNHFIFYILLIFLTEVLYFLGVSNLEFLFCSTVFIHSYNYIKERSVYWETVITFLYLAVVFLNLNLMIVNVTWLATLSYVFYVFLYSKEEVRKISCLSMLLLLTFVGLSGNSFPVELIQVFAMLFIIVKRGKKDSIIPISIIMLLGNSVETSRALLMVLPGLIFVLVESMHLFFRFLKTLDINEEGKFILGHFEIFSIIGLILIHSGVAGTPASYILAQANESFSTNILLTIFVMISSFDNLLNISKIEDGEGQLLPFSFLIPFPALLMLQISTGDFVYNWQYFLGYIVTVTLVCSSLYNQRVKSIIVRMIPALRRSVSPISPLIKVSKVELPKRQILAEGVVIRPIGDQTFVTLAIFSLMAFLFWSYV